MDLLPIRQFIRLCSLQRPEAGPYLYDIFLLLASLRRSAGCMKFILAKKLEMSQVFRPDGTVVPVTLLQAGPCMVTQVKSLNPTDIKRFRSDFFRLESLRNRRKRILRICRSFRFYENSERMKPMLTNAETISKQPNFPLET